MTATSQQIPVKLLLAIGFGMFLGVLSANSIPVLIGALIDGLAITEAEVGVLGTVELLAVASAALAAAPLALPLQSLAGLLLCISFFNIGSGAIWSFSERVGHQVGFSVEEAGFIIATGAVSGVIGALFAGWLGNRWGRRRPVILALVLAGLGYMILGGATGSTSYITGINIYWITYMFLIPLMIGAGAVMDPGGRAATLAAGAISLTFAIGPACGGYIATWFSYAAIGWFSCALCLLAALSFVLVRPVR